MRRSGARDVRDGGARGGRPGTTLRSPARDSSVLPPLPRQGSGWAEQGPRGGRPGGSQGLSLGGVGQSPCGVWRPKPRSQMLERLTGAGPPPPGAWATESGDLGRGAAPAAPVPQAGHSLGERGRTPGVTAGPGRGGGPHHVTPPPGAARSAPARAPVHAVVAPPAAAQLGMRPCGAAGSSAPRAGSVPGRSAVGRSGRKPIAHASGHCGLGVGAVLGTTTGLPGEQNPGSPVQRSVRSPAGEGRRPPRSQAARERRTSAASPPRCAGDCGAGAAGRRATLLVPGWEPDLCVTRTGSPSRTKSLAGFNVPLTRLVPVRSLAVSCTMPGCGRPSRAGSLRDPGHCLSNKIL